LLLPQRVRDGRGGRPRETTLPPGSTQPPSHGRKTRQFYHKVLEAAEGNREQAAHLLGFLGPAFRNALQERFGELAEQ